MNTSTAEAVQFWLLGGLAVVGSIAMVAARKAVYSALFLAVTMIILAVFYIAQGAVFLGVVQVVVYTGAVMMLFLFVLMLVGVDSADSLTETIKGQRPAAVAAGVGFGLATHPSSQVGPSSSVWRKRTRAATWKVSPSSSSSGTYGPSNSPESYSSSPRSGPWSLRIESVSRSERASRSCRNSDSETVRR